MDGCFLVILIISTANLNINNVHHKCVGMKILVCVYVQLLSLSSRKCTPHALKIVIIFIKIVEHVA